GLGGEGATADDLGRPRPPRHLESEAIDEGRNATRSRVAARAAAPLDAERVVPRHAAVRLDVVFVDCVQARRRSGPLRVRSRRGSTRPHRVASSSRRSSGLLRISGMVAQAPNRRADAISTRTAGGSRRLYPRSGRSRPRGGSAVRISETTASAARWSHHTPHSLRHTYASLLLQNGESVKFVQEQLGHKSIQLTVDLYGRWAKTEPIRGGANHLDEMTQPQTGSNAANKTTLSARKSTNPGHHTDQKKNVRFLASSTLWSRTMLRRAISKPPFTRRSTSSRLPTSTSVSVSTRLR